MQNLVPIGRFSKMVRLSVKALRHSDEIGLLVPAEVDRHSGYRYYAYSQANRAEAIRMLRSLDMPLDEIAEALASEDPLVAAKTLGRHQGRLVQELRRHERMVGFLQRLIEREERVMPYEVIVKEVAAQQVAAVRKHSSLATVGADVAQGFADLVGAVGKAGAELAGPPFMVMHDVIDEETDGDIELCFPLASPFVSDGEVRGCQRSPSPRPPIKVHTMRSDRPTTP